MIISGGADGLGMAVVLVVMKPCCVSISFHILHKICLLHIFTMPKYVLCALL